MVERVICSCFVGCIGMWFVACEPSSGDSINQKSNFAGSAQQEIASDSAPGDLDLIQPQTDRERLPGTEGLKREQQRPRRAGHDIGSGIRQYGVRLPKTAPEKPDKQSKPMRNPTKSSGLNSLPSQVESRVVSGRLSHMHDIYVTPRTSKTITVTFQNTDIVSGDYRLADSGSEGRGGWEIRKECREVVEGECAARNIPPGGTGTFDYSIMAPDSGSSTGSWVLKSAYQCDSYRCKTMRVDSQIIQFSVR